MIKQLQSTLFLAFLLFFSFLQAQNGETIEITSLLSLDVHPAHQHEHPENNTIGSEKVFSYIVGVESVVHTDGSSCSMEHGHSGHTSGVSLIDIITSDTGADFNCSGGFCMDKSHFHKKGLTLKKQLFGYFMKISC